MTRDPNETGMPIVAALAMNGEAVYILMSGFDGKWLYGDGMNLFEYLRSSPSSRRDPMGLLSAGGVGSGSVGSSSSCPGSSRYS